MAVPDGTYRASIDMPEAMREGIQARADRERRSFTAQCNLWLSERLASEMVREARAMGSAASDGQRARPARSER